MVYFCVFHRALLGGVLSNWCSCALRTWRMWRFRIWEIAGFVQDCMIWARLLNTIALRATLPCRCNRYTVHGRGAKHWFTPRQIIKSTPNITPQILQFINFFHPVTQSTSKTLFQSFKKVHQKFTKSSSNLIHDWFKTGFWLWAIRIDMYTLSTFFQKLFKNFSKPKNRSFKTPLPTGTWSPLISSSQKVITFFRTDGRTNIPVLTVRTDVKSATRNYE